MNWLKLILAIPDIVRAVMALISLVNEQKRKSKEKELDKLKKEIDNAETEDDFRDAARKLSKSR